MLPFCRILPFVGTHVHAGRLGIGNAILRCHDGASCYEKKSVWGYCRPALSADKAVAGSVWPFAACSGTRRAPSKRRLQ